MQKVAPGISPGPKERLAIHSAAKTAHNKISLLPLPSTI